MQGDDAERNKERKMTNGNDMALPQSVDHGVTNNGFPVVLNTGGLTKREYFASKVLSGILAGDEAIGFTVEEAVQRSVRAADILISALNKKDT